MIGDAGHLSMEEAPEVFSRMVLKFLAQGYTDVYREKMVSNANTR